MKLTLSNIAGQRRDEVSILSAYFQTFCREVFWPDFHLQVSSTSWPFMKLYMKLFFAGVIFHESFHANFLRCFLFHESFHANFLRCFLFHETLTIFSWKSFLINTSFFSSNCFERISIFDLFLMYNLNKCISFLRNIKLERNQYKFAVWYVSNDTLLIWVC